jgi:hypothetical protein
VKIFNVVRAWGIFIVAQKRPLERRVMDIKYASEELDRELEIEFD